MIIFTAVFIVVTYFLYVKLDDIARGVRTTGLKLQALTNVAHKRLSITEELEVPYMKMSNAELERQESKQALMNSFSDQDKINSIMEAERERREMRIQNLTMEILRTYHFDMQVPEARARAEGIITQIEQSMMPPFEEAIEEAQSEAKPQESQEAPVQ